MQLRDLLSGRRRAAHTSARALGWFSIGLGFAELALPSLIARLIGLPQSAAVVQAYGAREIATGVGILAAKDPTPWVSARVAGDALDLFSLGAGMRNSDSKVCTLGAIMAVVGVTLADLATAQILGELRDKDRTPYPDYSARSGLGSAPQARRVAAEQPAPVGVQQPLPTRATAH